MPRANRYFLPKYIWHITHRCHKKEFLLKFSRDRKNWVRWLFEARKRFGLRVFNYSVTSNHIHLLAQTPENNAEAIPESMQLIAGRVAQDYNQRKGRKGAFWEDRYHATAVDRENHLLQCLVYIDLNMVRAGQVKHPKDWAESGFQEIQGHKERYRTIDLKGLSNTLGFQDLDLFQKFYREMIEHALSERELGREEKWTKSIGVGGIDFLSCLVEALGVKVRNRKILPTSESYVLRETFFPYESQIDAENTPIRPNNSHFWRLDRP